MELRPLLLAACLACVACGRLSIREDGGGEAGGGSAGINDNQGNDNEPRLLDALRIAPP